jgi:hypothetical protein
MPKPLLYLTGEEIRKGDRVLLHGDAANLDFVLDGESNPEGWLAETYGRGIMISEPKIFVHLFLPEATQSPRSHLFLPSPSNHLPSELHPSRPHRDILSLMPSNQTTPPNAGPLPKVRRFCSEKSITRPHKFCILEATRRHHLKTPKQDI